MTTIQCKVPKYVWKVETFRAYTVIQLGKGDYSGSVVQYTCNVPNIESVSVSSYFQTLRRGLKNDSQQNTFV